MVNSQVNHLVKLVHCNAPLMNLAHFALLHVYCSCLLSVALFGGIHICVGTYTRDPNEVFDFLTSLISQAKRKGSVYY